MEVDIYSSSPDKPQRPYLLVKKGDNMHTAHPDGLQWRFWKTRPLVGGIIGVDPVEAENAVRIAGYYILK